MTDDELILLVRSAVRPVRTSGPARDLWPTVVAGSRQRPSWSWLDIGLAVAAAIVLLAHPDLFLVLVYHF
jgi:hypothetical protein